MGSLSIPDYRFRHNLVSSDGQDVKVVVADIGYRIYLVYFFFNGSFVCIQVSNGGENCYLSEQYPEELEAVHTSFEQLPEATPLLKHVAQTAMDWYR